MLPHARPLIRLLIIFAVALSTAPAQARDEQAEALFQEGYTLYQQRYGAVAITPLEEAANLGHAEAAYWVGEILRKRYSYITDEAEEFYIQAADGGEVYAMLRFAQKGGMCGTLRDCDYDRSKWIDRALGEALPKAEAGDPDAMKAVYSTYRVAGEKGKAWDWIKRAAERGHIFSQYWVAILLEEQKMGFYWTENARQNDIVKWLSASADQGYPPAMLKLAITLRERGDLEQARYWVEQMARTDYYDAVVEAGAQIMMGSHIADIYLSSISYHFDKPRPVQGAALLIAVNRQTGSKEPLEAIDDYRQYLTPEILAEAEALSKNLLVNTPLIYYLPKFGM